MKYDSIASVLRQCDKPENSGQSSRSFINSGRTINSSGVAFGSNRGGRGRDRGKKCTYTCGNNRNNYFNGEVAQCHSYGYYRHIASDQKRDGALKAGVESRPPLFKGEKVNAVSANTKTNDNPQKH